MKNLLLVSDTGLTILQGFTLLLLTLTAIFYTIKKVKGPGKFIDELVNRTNSWWIILALFVFTFLWNVNIAFLGTTIFSLFAFREVVRHLNPSNSDKKILFFCYLAIPLQFFWAYIDYFNGFITWIPMTFFVFLTFLIVACQRTEGISRTIGVIHWTLMVTAFSFAHLPYFLTHEWPIHYVPADILLFVVFVTETNDVFQFTWGKILGRHKIIPNVSPNKTWEGFLGGMLSTMVLGYFLRGLLPFPTEKVLLLCIYSSLIGFFGDVTLSAIKRECGVKDMSNLIAGHGGLMDRADSLAFTSIFFFHLVNLWSP